LAITPQRFTVGPLVEKVSVRLGLRKKLVVGVFIYLTLLAVVGLLGLYAAQVSLSGMHAAVDHHVREVSLVGELSADVNLVESTLMLHALSRSVEEEGPYEQQVVELQHRVSNLVEQLLQIQEQFGDEPDIDRIRSFQSVWNDFLRVENEQFLPLSRDQRDDEAFELAQAGGSLGQSFAAVRANVAMLQSELPKESTEQLEKNEEEFATNRNILVVTLLAAGLIGVILGLSQAERLARAIEALSQAAGRVAQANFTEQVVVHTGDELEHLAGSFNSMTVELRRIAEERRAMERMKDEFISMVSHELRTPMNGVIGMHSLLLRGKLGPREREYAEAAQRSGEALLAIIDDILDLSKIEAGHLELDDGVLDVAAVVEDVVVLLADQAHKKNLELVCLVDPSVPRNLCGDLNRLRQILLNLVGNAIKFTEMGGAVVRATLIDATAEAVHVRIEVTDTGIGIAEDAHDKIFRPFSRLEGAKSRRSGGTGLGLAISKRLAELMGGTLGFDSQPGRGSTFWATLRFRFDSAPAAAVKHVAHGDLNGTRVLVVDDNPLHRGVLLEQLAVAHIDAVGCTDATTVLEQLRGQVIAGEPYELVLLDRNLGQINALALAREIASEPLLGTPAVVLMNRLGERLAAEDIAAARVWSVLDKPVRLARLLDTIHRAANRLPLQGGASAAGTQWMTETAGAPPPGAGAPERGRVLVVEDEAVSRRVAAHMLCAMGFDVDVVSNGREALDVLDMHVDATPYTAVLMDCQMPEMDGFETTVAIRRREQGGAPIPIIAMTASAMRGDREHCIAVGMTDYIAKPLRYETLEAVIAQYAPNATPLFRPHAGLPRAATPGGAIDWQAVADLACDLDRAGDGDGGALASMIAEFRAETGKRLHMLRQASQAADGVALRTLAHSLRGSASTLGADEVRDLAAQLEQVAAQQGAPGVDAIIQALAAALDRAWAALESTHTPLMAEAACRS
jgi:two-component system, sensor histidine kinase and response regulator